MKKFVLLLAVAMIVALAAQANPAAAAAGLFRTGAFAEVGPMFPYPVENQGRIAVNFDTGDVYVADSRNDQVTVYRQNGGSADLLTSFGSGDLDNPLGVAIDQDNGTVYVSDAEGITKYDSDNAPTPAFTADGSFAAVAATGSLAFDQSANELVVADTSANIIRRYSTVGIAGATFDGTGSPNTFGTGSTFTRLQDLAVDMTGDVIVIDTTSDPGTGGTSRIERFSSAGSWTATIGPVEQAATVGVIPATNEVVVGGNQNSADLNEYPTVRRFTANGTDEGLLALNPSVEYGTTTGIAADDDASYRLHVATDVSAGSWQGLYALTSIQNYDLLEPPTVAIEPATDVRPFRVTLNGRVNPEGAETTYHFEISADGGASWTPVDPDFDGDESAGAGTVDVEVSVTAPDLAENSGYQSRLVANRGFAPATSDATSFTTARTTDGITTSSAIAAATTATVGGSINPHGLSTTYQVEYRRRGFAGYQRAPATPADAGSGTTAAPFSVGLTGLRPNTVYEWRVVVNNAEYAATVGGVNFTTGLSAPRAETTAPTNLQPNSARLNALLDPYGQSTTYRFEYGPTSAYGTVTPPRTNSSNKPVRIFVDLTGLTPGQEVHYRIVATTATGTTTGDDRTLVLPRSVRAYEMVSPPDKGGADPLGAATPMAGAAGGEFAYTAATANGPSVQSVAGVNVYLSRRDSTAWNTKGLGYPLDNLRELMVGPLRDVSEDMTHTFGMSTRALAPGAIDGQYNYYITDIRTGTARLVAGSEEQGARDDYAQDYSQLRGATPDYSHVLFVSQARLVPGLEPLPSWDTFVYDAGPDGIRLASVDSDGNPLTLVQMVNPDAVHVRHLISEDGRRIFLSGFAADGKPGVYMREDGQRTVRVSTSQRAGEEDLVVEGLPMVMDATADGSAVFFTTTQALLPGSEDPSRQTSRIYRYQVDSHELTEIYVAPDGTPAPATAGLADDGSRLFFRTGSTVHVWQRGAGVRTVAEHAEVMSTNAEASTLAILTSASLLDEDECEFEAGDERCSDVYVYDVAGDELSCASCDAANRVTGTTVIGGAGSDFLAVGYRTLGWPIGMHRVRAVDARGGVFVDTQKQLASEDNDNAFDVYYVRDGVAELITVGTTTDSVFGDASDDGEDVYFSTRDRLVGVDVDDNRDYYTARLGGGLASQRGAGGTSRPCEADACQGTATLATAGIPAASVNFVGAGNVLPTTRPGPVARPRVTAVRAVRGARASIKVRVAEPGRIRVSGAGLRVDSRTVDKGGTYVLRATLTSTAAKRLARTGKVLATVRVTFIARGRQPHVLSVKLTFRSPRAAQTVRRSSTRRTADHKVER
jgi:hypothetical protein